MYAFSTDTVFLKNIFDLWVVKSMVAKPMDTEGQMFIYFLI
jgi:hypothetical protein